METNLIAVGKMMLSLLSVFHALPLARSKEIASIPLDRGERIGGKAGQQNIGISSFLVLQHCTSGSLSLGLKGRLAITGGKQGGQPNFGNVSILKAAFIARGSF